MNKFPRRLYNNPGEFIEDLRFIMPKRPLIKRAMRGDLIPAAFRERLMMMVTQVHGCRYCSYFHAKQALNAGISEAELQDIIAGFVPDNAPQDEYVALLYAQHWAESNAQPDPAAFQKLAETYGKEKTDAIHIILRMIRVGNLMGNLWDYLLYRISFGKLGLTKAEKAQ
jgi:AhpD family alkylhydroperoxidase